VVVAVNVTALFTCGAEGETVKLVVCPGGVDVPKISVIGEAAASLAVRVGRAQLFSIKWRTENSSYRSLEDTYACLTAPGS
jgi:hypothetical protein